MAKFLSYEGRLEIENGLKNINLMMDHINSYRKKKLNGKSPSITFLKL